MIDRCSWTIESQERKAARDFRRDQSGGKAAISKFVLALVAVMIVTYITYRRTGDPTCTVRPFMTVYRIVL